MSNQFQDLLHNVYVMRHGQPLQAVDPNLWLLGRDSVLTLTEKGVRQVQAAAGLMQERLRDLSGHDTPFRVVSSEVPRAKQSAAVFCHGLSDGPSGIQVGQAGRSSTYLLNEFFVNETGSWPQSFDFESYMKDPFHLGHPEWDYGDEDPEPQSLRICTFQVMVAECLRLLRQELRYRLGFKNTWSSKLRFEGGFKNPAPVVWVGHHFKTRVLQLVATMVSDAFPLVMPRDLLNDQPESRFHAVEKAMNRAFRITAIPEFEEAPSEQGELARTLRSVALATLATPMECAEINLLLDQKVENPVHKTASQAFLRSGFLN